MKLGKCIVIPVEEGVNTNELVEKNAVLDLDDPDLQETIAKFAFDQTEDGEITWEHSEPIDKAYEIEYVQWLLKILTTIAKKSMKNGIR